MQYHLQWTLAFPENRRRLNIFDLAGEEDVEHWLAQKHATSSRPEPDEMSVGE
jgi:hypothetical protein